MSIRARLILLILLATVLPAILVGVRYVEDRTKEIDAAIDELSDAARGVATNLDEKIQGTAQLQFGLARAGELMVRDRVACSRFLSELLQKQPQYTGILTIDPDGSLYCDSLATGRTLDLRDRNYFQKALTTVGTVVLEPVFGRLTGIPVLQIAFPARDSVGQLKFVLLASLNLQNFAETHAAALPRDTELLFVDGKGTVMFWTPSARHEGAPGTSIADTELFRFAAENSSGTREIADAEGNIRLWTLADTEVTRGSGLHLLVGRSMAELVAAPNRRLHEDLAILSGMLLLLFVGVWLVGELGIRYQIARIAQMAGRLSAGDLAARIEPPHAKGELGSLMTVLNDTAASLEKQRFDIDELNQKLRQSQKLEAVGQLTGGIAHDFNNLLTVIISSAELLDERWGRGGPDDRKFLRNILVAGQQGAELTKRLLAFARRQPLQPKVVNINEFVTNLKPLLARTIGEDVDIRINLGAGLWNAEADPSQVEAALLNLAINARDAMPEGGHLMIETANVEIDKGQAEEYGELQPGHYVSLSVTDDGCGMPPEVLARAIEPFFTTKDIGKGTGLGLSMVFGFAKQSGGHMTIYSEIGHGTTVRLYLPRVRATVTAVEAADFKASETGGSGELILVVEDDAAVREIALNMLRNLGYRVVDAANGKDAIAAFEKHRPIDLLFTDVIMPGGLSGPTLVRELRQRQPDLKVLYTSGYTENAIVHQGKLDEGVLLLNKPYRRNELVEKIRAALKGETNGNHG